MQIPMSDIYKINGEPIPQPSNQGFDSEDIQTADSGRTQSGYMLIEIVAFGKRSIQIKYDAMPQNQMQEIMSKFHSAYYDFTYFDAEYGIRTMKCYNPGRKSDLYHAILYNGVWKSVEFTFIEA